MEQLAGPVIIARALRLLDAQRRASKNYYTTHQADVKQRCHEYWTKHKDDINARRRARYQEQKKPANIDGHPALPLS